MPPSRVTRSSARLAADHNREDHESAEPNPPTTTKETPKPKKRKAATTTDSSPAQPELDNSSAQSATRQSKRQKTTSTTSYPTATTPQTSKSSGRRPAKSQTTAMSSSGNEKPSGTTEKTIGGSRSSSRNDEEKQPRSSKSSSRRASGRTNTKPDQSTVKSPTHATSNHDTDPAPPSDSKEPRKSKKKSSRSKDSDKEMKDVESKSTQEKVSSPPPPTRTESNSDMSPDSTRGDDVEAFTSALFGRGGPSGLSNTLRALSGMMSGMTSRFRDILTNLRRVDDPTMQMIALEELSNLLLVSNEDNLTGQFSPDPYVKELVALMQPNPITGEENPEIMLLACRSLANLMEALRGSVGNVVYGGAVPVLCQKLLDIQYIDVAEQALSTLSKVSIDFPASIVRAGGLTACLQYLDFFATGTQRTAVTTAANCCRSIPHDSFAVIRDVMPTLQNVLSSHDQKVVEQGCLCVTRIIDSFKHSSEKIEELVDPPLLKAILGLLLPGTTNLIGAGIHTEFLRVLAIVARNSPKLSAELLKMNVVDTLYQILTGVSPPSETATAAANIDSVVIMQALIHRPREQIYEALNVICELLPKVTTADNIDAQLSGLFGQESPASDASGSNKPSKTQIRRDLLAECKRETRRFAMILLPTLTDAYSSTVNLSVRQKVLTGQLKILSNLDTAVIEEALRPVPYASFLASILSQEDHPSLVMFALQASELLFERLEQIYKYQFYREGVIGEIKKLASRSSQIDAKVLAKLDSRFSASSVNSNHTAEEVAKEDDTSSDSDNDDAQDDDDGDEDDEDEAVEDIILHEDDGLDDDQSSDSSSHHIPSPIAISGIQDLVIIRAQRFIEKYDKEAGRELRVKAEQIRHDLRELAGMIRGHYTTSSPTNGGEALFDRLARYFHGDALESITSSELLDSGIIKLLGDVLGKGQGFSNTARQDFVRSFLTSSNNVNMKTSVVGTTPTALSVLVYKLQDLLSRSEHFEVLTVNSNASENSRSSSTSMLSRQLKLRLTAENEGDIPSSYRDIVVSIHAIATFKALDEYLRPRMALSERPSSGRRRDMLQQLANARMAQLSGAAESGLLSPFGLDLGMGPPSAGPRTSSHTAHKSKSESQATETNTSKDSNTKFSRRRSARHSAAAATTDSTSADPEKSIADPPKEEETVGLEIVDEKVIQNDPPSAAAAPAEPVDSVTGEVEEEVSDDEPEPDAVNMEIAATGRVTARREDGSRVYTPRQPGTPAPASRSASADHTPTSTPTHGAVGQKRPSSYAAAAATQQDWHIEFSIDGKPIPSNITIYRAVHHNREQPPDAAGRNVWTGIHEVKFKKVKGPQPTLSLSTADEKEKDTSRNGLPVSLDGHPITSSILMLLGSLHELNASLGDIAGVLKVSSVNAQAEPLASFINTKLTAKMNRQLEEPLIVASNCLPDWSEDLARAFPFLFPFETRHLFLQSTSFGYSRSITRWQSSQTDNDDRRDRRRDDRPMMGRPMRQKVRIARAKMLESAMKVMDHFGATPSILEVEYFDEVGTGLGPTLEFYSTVSKEFAKKQMKLWREDEANTQDLYVFSKNGLFPAPMTDAEQKTETGKKILHAFKVLGMFVARAMLDSRIIDINFNPTFFKIAGDVEIEPSIALLRTVDPDLAGSISKLEQYAASVAEISSNTDMDTEMKAATLANVNIGGASLEDLALDFTLPGYEHIDLIENGSTVDVTNENVGTYVQKVLDFTLGAGVRTQIEAFQKGFSQVFPYSSLKAFTPDELVMLFGRVEEDWNMETLMDSIKADHGFNMDSKSVKNLLQVMSEMSAPQRRDFLQFVTGSPRLPIGGFKSLTPMFTVVCKPSEPPYTSDDYLPSVMTCANYLKLPDYSDVDILKNKLGVAIKEGQGAFHLS